MKNIPKTLSYSSMNIPVSPGCFTGSRVAIPSRVNTLFSGARRHGSLSPKLRKMAHFGYLR